MIERDALITHWLETKGTLKEWEAYELSIRKRVIAATFANHTARESETVQLGNGYKISVSFPNNFKVTGNEDALQEHLDLLAKVGDAGAFIAENLVQWKPKISATVWNQLDDATKHFLAQFVEVSDGTPQVTFTEPKS